MGLLNSQDKEIIKRALPKNSNKIIDVTIARLYIAYPDKTQWQYTGLSGAITLVDDLVGHTFFLKLIDIFGHRGIIWDQELYINFQYYQDRTFFHTFEIEDCYVGLLFVDIKEAEHFLKRVQKREKYASRATLQNKKAIALNKKLRAENAKKQPKQGPRGETMVVMDSQRKRYNYNEVEHIPVTKNKAPPPPPPSSSSIFSHNDIDTNEGDTDQYNDGFDEDAYYNDTDVQSSTLSVQPAVSGHSTVADTVSSTEQKEQASELPTHQKVKHNVPPLPANFQPAPPLSNNTTTTIPVPSTTNVSQLQPSSFSNQPFNNATQQANNSFPFPIPQMNNTNMNLHRPVPQLPNRTPSINMNINSNINTARPVPAPPPRQNINTGGVPPLPPVRRGPAPPLPPHRNNNNMNNQRISSNNGVPPPPPVRRGPAPPPPPARTRTQPTILQPKTSFGQDTFTQQYNQQMPQVTFGQSAPLSQQTEIPPHTTFNTAPQSPVQPVPSFRPLNSSSNMNYNNNNTAAIAHPIPPIMNNNNNTNLVHIAPPAPPLMSNNTNVNAPVAPPPPPMMNSNSMTTPPAPPPPPVMNNSEAPVAPPPPVLATDNNNSGFVESTGDAGRDALLASIRGAGGIKSLRKVDKSQLDRPSVLLQEARGETVATSNTGNETASSNMGAGGPPSLADALAAALNKRKNKVGVHEDDDVGDDW
ncbi:actin-binding protein LAS17 PWA37_001317 [Arxiozyma heterogenica]|uniref:actin-binding protein LAS17 n=1 Tax=Arxiozyma heterogenica TaxID=278026 RepID=UPI002F16FE6C